MHARLPLVSLLRVAETTMIICFNAVTRGTAHPPDAGRLTHGFLVYCHRSLLYHCMFIQLPVDRWSQLPAQCIAELSRRDQVARPGCFRHCFGDGRLLGLVLPDVKCVPEGEDL